jgi:hypothetical protein
MVDKTWNTECAPRPRDFEMADEFMFLFDADGSSTAVPVIRHASHPRRFWCEKCRCMELSGARCADQSDYGQ